MLNSNQIFSLFAVGITISSTIFSLPISTFAMDSDTSASQSALTKKIVLTKAEKNLMNSDKMLLQVAKNLKMSPEYVFALYTNKVRSVDDLTKVMNEYTKLDIEKQRAEIAEMRTKAKSKNSGLNAKQVSDINTLADKMEKKLNLGDSLNSNSKNTSKSLTGGQLASYFEAGEFIITMNYSVGNAQMGIGHAIMALGSNRSIESMPAGGEYRNGVQYTPGDIFRYTNQTTGKMTGYYFPYASWKGQKAADYAKNQDGKPYSYQYLWGKWYEDRFYCSQLVWRAWKNQGVEIDYISWDYMVTPAELTKSGNVRAWYRW